MNFAVVIWRNLLFHRAAHAAALAGIAVATAALTGALVVGDSVRGTLRRQALDRVGGASFVITAGDNFFREALCSMHSNAVPILVLPASVRTASGGQRANNAQVIGIRQDYLVSNRVVDLALDDRMVLLSRSLAAQLDVGVGDEILLRMARSGGIPGEAALNAGRDAPIGWRIVVTGILPPAGGGDLNLQGSGAEAFNVFVPLHILGRQLEVEGKANVLLVKEGAAGGEAISVATLERRLREHWTLEDAGLSVASLPGDVLAISSPRVFLRDAVLEAARRSVTNTVPVLTYLANLLECGTNATPYSMVTAAGPPYTSGTLRDNEILLSPWLAEDLSARIGDTIRMSFFLPDAGARLQEATNEFRVAGIAPRDSVHLDRTLMPRFPGIEEAERTQDWDAGFPLKYKIRDKDEDYWESHRGTPKAFVSLAAGQRIWANRFGNLTSIRVAAPGLAVERLEASLLSGLQPSGAGFAVTPVRDQALGAADQSQDFGQLFLAFSMFIIAAALLLIVLLVQFALESRSVETGALMAAGFSRGRLRALFMCEFLLVSLTGAAIGAALGVFYAKALLRALTTLWRAAVGGINLELHLNHLTLLLAVGISTALCAATIWLVVRARSGRQPAALLSGEVEAPAVCSAGNMSGVIAIGSITSALLLGAWSLKQSEASPGAFFGAGCLVLVGGLALFWRWMGRPARVQDSFSRMSLVLRSPARRPRRSLAAVAMLASGCFVLVAVSAFRLNTPAGMQTLGSGTGGFNVVASAALPIQQDLSTDDGREALGLKALPGSTFIVPFRVSQGDEASCLNLNRAGRPRLLGVKPLMMKGRFAFSRVADGFDARQGWDILRGAATNNIDQPLEIPAVGDANSVRWSMGKKVGDTIEMVGDSGRTIRVRIVAVVADSIFQGSLVVDEALFLSAFPGSSGYRYFLVDAPGGAGDEAAMALSAALEDYGLETIPVARRMATLNAVQNTYLSTFQVLGGLGLLLGSVGLGLLILRNVLERRPELAAMLATGCRTRLLRRIVAGEHALLLAAAVVTGTVAALVAVMPALKDRDAGWGGLAVVLCLVLCNGLLWTWAAAVLALRGPLLDALRND